MDFTFRCPHCDQKITAGDELSGSEASCPSCAGGLVIPAVQLQPPEAPPPAPTYFYLDANNQKVGQFNHAQIVAKIDTQELIPKTFIWSDGFDTWRHLNELKQFIPALDIVEHRLRRQREQQTTRAAKEAKSTEAGCTAAGVVFAVIVYAVIRGCAEIAKRQ